LQVIYPLYTLGLYVFLYWWAKSVPVNPFPLLKIGNKIKLVCDNVEFYFHDNQYHAKSEYGLKNGKYFLLDGPTFEVVDLLEDGYLIKKESGEKREISYDISNFVLLD
jgi:hypothetical protein